MKEQTWKRLLFLCLPARRQDGDHYQKQVAAYALYEKVGEWREGKREQMRMMLDKCK